MKNEQELGRSLRRNELVLGMIFRSLDGDAEMGRDVYDRQRRGRSRLHMNGNGSGVSLKGRIQQIYLREHQHQQNDRKDTEEDEKGKRPDPPALHREKA